MSGPFGQMVTALVSAPTPRARPNHPASHRNGKTALLRATLDKGPASAAQLTAIANLSTTSLVSALLKHDITCDRVEYVDGMYRRTST